MLKYIMIFMFGVAAYGQTGQSNQVIIVQPRIISIGSGNVAKVQPTMFLGMDHASYEALCALPAMTTILTVNLSNPLYMWDYDSFSGDDQIGSGIEIGITNFVKADFTYNPAKERAELPFGAMYCGSGWHDQWFDSLVVGFKDSGSPGANNLFGSGGMTGGMIGADVTSFDIKDSSWDR